MSASRYIARRLLLLVFVLFGISLITFTVARVIPSDPAATYVGGMAKPDQIAVAREKLGLDRPLYEQYVLYVTDTLQGDMGTSLVSKRPVLNDILQFLPVSLQLIGFALVLAVIVGVPLGAVTARYKGSWIDQGGRVISIIGVSFPSFAIALLLQIFFCRFLGLLPVGGKQGIVVSQLYPVASITGFDLLDAALTGNWTAFWDLVQHMILPVLAIAAYPTGVIMRMMRSSMLETLQLEFVRMSKAMGVPMRSITSRWAAKHALGPVITVIGLMFAYAMIGTFFVELIFAYPGLGLYAVNAIISLDYPVIMGVTLVIATMYVLTNLVVDLILARIDPRVILQ